MYEKFFEKVKNCPVCGSQKIVLIRSNLKTVDYLKIKLNFSILKCNKCKTSYLNHRIKGGYKKKFYNKFYYNNYKRVNIEHISKNGNNLYYLEVGVGTGNHLNMVIKKGIYDHICVVDIDEREFRIGSRKDRFKYINDDIEDVRLDSYSFDYIFISHVIEHVTNPVKVFEKLYKSLANGGSIEMYTPNFESLAYKYLPYLADYSCPHHMFFFSKDSLVYILKKLNIVNYKFNYEWGNSLANTIASRFRNSVCKKISKFLLSPISILLEIVFNQKDNIKIVIKKLN